MTPSSTDGWFFYQSLWLMAFLGTAGCHGKIFVKQAADNQNQTITNPCNPFNLSGTCNKAEVCVQGICYAQGQAPQVCQKGVNGACPNPSNACSKTVGICTPITSLNGCSSSNPNGLCPGGQLCALGYCYTDDGTIACSSSNPKGLCQNGGTCTNGACATFASSCNAGNFNGACPTWQTCVEGSTCVGPVPPNGCTSQNLDGICPASPVSEICVAGTCTPITADNVCTPNHLSGLCASGSACVGGFCQAITGSNNCSSSQPSGLCQGGAQCKNGTCVSAACGAGGWQCDNPDNSCIAGACQPLPCDPVHPNGICSDATQACVSGICTTPLCSSQYLNGVCETGLICMDGTCSAPPCSSAYPASSSYCSSVPIADANGVYSIEVTAVCQQGTCQASACGNGVNGTCPAGQYCFNNSTCLPIQCSVSYPTGVCLSSGQVCSAGACTITCSSTNDCSGGMTCQPQTNTTSVCSSCPAIPQPAPRVTSYTFSDSIANYQLLLESEYTSTLIITQNNMNIGLIFDDPTTADSQNYIAGFGLSRKFSSPVSISQQVQSDLSSIKESSAISAISTLSSRSFNSYDSYPSIINTYNITTKTNITAQALRDNLIQQLNSSLGQWASTLTQYYAKNPQSFNYVDNNFVLMLQTLYRDNGNVLTVAAVASNTQFLSSSNIGFSMDNITNGSSLGMFNYTQSNTCQDFNQQNGLVDFLWTIDNSPSMAPKIGQVYAAAQNFFSFINNSEADYRVAFTTTSNTAASGMMPPLVDACASLITEESCLNPGNLHYGSGQGGCSWDSTNNVCAEICTFYDSATCATQPGCMIHPANQKCIWGGCATLTDPNACQNTSPGSTSFGLLGCTWSATANNGSGACGLVGTPDFSNGHIIDFTGAVAGQANMNLPDRTVSYKCEDGCTMGNYLKSDICSANTRYGATICQSNKACQWDSGSNQCKLISCCPACANSPTTAPNDPTADHLTTAPNDPACYFASRLPNDIGAGSNGHEYGLALTELAIYRAGGQPICALLQSMDTCNKTPGCLWDNNVCIPGYCNNTDVTAKNIITGTTSTLQNQCNGWEPVLGDLNKNLLPNVALDKTEPCTQLPDVYGMLSGATCGLLANEAWAYEMPAYCEWNGSTCYPSIGVRCTGLTQPECGIYPDKCTWNGTKCTLTQASSSSSQSFNWVMCNATTETQCNQQGKGQCEWDTCTSYTTLQQCGAVHGCQWSNAACAPVLSSVSGTCRPLLTKMLRNNAKKISIIISDEEECYLKDGDFVTPYADGGLDTWASPYSGECGQSADSGGFFAYSDPVRISRVNAYRDFFLSRGFTVFGLVGDIADETQAPWSVYQHIKYSNLTQNGGCQSPINPAIAAEAGQSYIDVANATRGGWGSICQQDLSPTIRQAIQVGIGQASPYVFLRTPISATIQVQANICVNASDYPNCTGGDTQTVAVPRSTTNGFDYDSVSNTLVFYGTFRPVPLSLIQVWYQYWQNPADACGGGCGYGYSCDLTSNTCFATNIGG